MPRLHCCIPLVLASLALAQTKDVAPTTTPAAPPVLQFQLAGPATFRTLFAPTNFGTMLASAEGEKLWRQRLQPVDLALQAALGGGEAAAGKAARDLLLDYAGRIELSVWLASRSTIIEPRVLVAIGCSGDGHTDLDALTELLRRLLERGAGATFPADGVVPPVLPVGKLFVGRPQRHDQLVLTALASDAADLPDAWQHGRAQPAPDAKAPPLRFRLDGVQAWASSTARKDATATAVLRILGLPALTECSLTLAPAGPHVMLELSAAFGDGDRGVLGAFLPASSVLPRLLPLVPANQTWWKAGHFDVRALYTAIEQGVGELLGQSQAQMRQTVKEDLGLDPLTDLFPHLTDEVLLLGSMAPGKDDEDEAAPTDFTLVWRLNDTAAFQRSFTTVREHLRPFLQEADTSERDGVTFTRYSNLLQVPLHMAIGRGLWVVAVGKHGDDRLAAVLEAARSAPPDAAPPPPPADLKPLQHFVPPGLNGIGRSDLRALLAVQLAALFGLLEEVVGTGWREQWPASDYEQLLGELTPLLQKHQLETLRTLTGYDQGRWRFRAFW